MVIFVLFTDHLRIYIYITIYLLCTSCKDYQINASGLGPPLTNSERRFNGIRRSSTRRSAASSGTRYVLASASANQSRRIMNDRTDVSVRQSHGTSLIMPTDDRRPA